jgi:hypothetical protein
LPYKPHPNLKNSGTGMAIYIDFNIPKSWITHPYTIYGNLIPGALIIQISK